ANQGIGKAIAAGLAREGFTVYLGARDLERGVAAAGELSAIGDVRSLRLDVTSQADVAAAVATIDEQAGHLDALVNNAGVAAGHRRAFERPPTPLDETADDLRFVYE